MQRLTTILVALLFIVWILPLGIFIKPEYEQKACHGKRAICLCKKLLAKKLARMKNKTFLKKLPTTQTQKTEPSSSAPDYLHALHASFNKINKTKFHNIDQYPSTTPLVNPIDHVPKA